MEAVVNLLLFLAVLGAASGSPVSYFFNSVFRSSTQKKVAHCGTEIDTLLELENDEAHLTTDGLLDEEGNLPGGCVIDWRYAAKDLSLEEYGMEVRGEIDLQDPCTSNYVKITDSDTGDDEYTTSNSYCGKKTIYFKTFQDSVNVILHTGPVPAPGGIDLKVNPVYMCGGVVEQDATIESPMFPSPYPQDALCFWSLKPPENHLTVFTFETFDLRPKNGNHCVDLFKIEYHNFQEDFCDTTLDHQTMTYDAQYLVAEFRTAKPNNYVGFRCHISFLPRE